MKQRYSPIATLPSFPHEIYEKKKEACDRAAELNRKSTFNDYWVQSASLKQAASS